MVDNGGVVLGWPAETVGRRLAAEARRAGRAPAELLLEHASRAAAGSGGLLLLPQVLGERARTGPATPVGPGSG